MVKKLVKAVTVSNAAIITGLSKVYIRQLCRSGLIKSEKVGRDWIMTEQAIQPFIKEQKINGIEQ